MESETEVKTLTPPLIMVQPESQIVKPGETACFQVAASGSRPLSYRWEKDGRVILGENTSLCSAKATEPDTWITVTIRNAAGEVQSNPARLQTTASAQPAPAMESDVATRTRAVEENIRRLIALAQSAEQDAEAFVAIAKRARFEATSALRGAGQQGYKIPYHELQG